MRPPCAALIALLPALIASTARAYLLDLSDATVARRGELELEVQPIGYLGAFGVDHEHALVLPSLNAVVGFGSGWDLTLTMRGVLHIEGAAYGVAQNQLAFRVVLADGGYSSGHGTDPSLVVQWGSYLPDIHDQTTGLAPSIALLGSQVIGEASVHLHVELILTPDREGELFVSTVLQAPDGWSVQPVAELWIDLADDRSPLVSGLLGAVVPIGGDLALEGGARVAGWRQLREVEVRLALAWSSRWLPAR